MPPCVECHYPYATSSKCKNCGCTNPMGKEEKEGCLSTILGWLFAAAIVYGVIRYFS